MCITETTLHLQELYSSAQAFLTQSVKRRNINVVHFAKQKHYQAETHKNAFKILLCCIFTWQLAVLLFYNTHLALTIHL
jgi:hypothetical protein